MGKVGWSNSGCGRRSETVGPMERLDGERNREKGAGEEAFLRQAAAQRAQRFRQIRPFEIRAGQQVCVFIQQSQDSRHDGSASRADRAIRTSCPSSRSKFSSVSDVGLSRRGEAKSRFLPDNGSDVFGSAGRRPRLAQPVQEGRKGRYQRNV